MTVVDVIDLDDDEWYVKVDVIDLSTDEDSVEKDGNVEEEEDDNVPQSENLAVAATSSPISEQDATAKTSSSMVEHGSAMSSLMVENSMQLEYQESLATSDGAKDATQLGNHELIAASDCVGEAMQSEREAYVFSSMPEQAATSLLLIKQGAITLSVKEDKSMESGNQVFVAAVDCAKEAIQSENTVEAAGSLSMTERSATCKSHHGNTTYYMVRHSGSKGCTVRGCTNGAHGDTPLCIFHNSRPHKRCCEVIGCITAACKGSQGSIDRCVKHGGGKRCKYDACGKGAQGTTDYCIAHGGGRRCKFPGCTKSAQGRYDYCIRHGGGRRCKFLECSASATCVTDFCSVHRTSLLSGSNSDREILPAPMHQAKKAEPSKRRRSHSVIGERSQKRQSANDYVNPVVETGEEKGRVIVCQNNMLKAQQTTHRLNSESGVAAGSPSLQLASTSLTR
ncbi:unnamed protein product [Alopecurus aequalis]